MKPGVLIEEVLKLLDKTWVSSVDIEQILSQTLPNALDENFLTKKIIVANQMLNIYRKTPDIYFNENNQRENILEAIQEALDDLINEEESLGEEEIEDEDDSGLDFNF